MPAYKYLAKVAAPLTKRGVRYVYRRSGMLRGYTSAQAQSANRTMTVYRSNIPKPVRGAVYAPKATKVEFSASRGFGRVYGSPTSASLGRIARVFRSIRPRYR